MNRPCIPTVITRLLTQRRGGAAVEMGLIGSVVLMPLLGSLVGLGQALAMQIQLDRALHAALLTAYGTAASLTSSTVQSAMTTAVQNGYGNPNITPTVSASLVYYCINPTSIRSGSGSATAPTCSAPQVVATYLNISISAGFVPLVNVGISGWNQAGSGTVTLSSTATVRIK